ncbi:MAG: hypothetical protein JRI23_31945 [Deltaproteobacteria bacterium]|jgi:hypothetical protein|nr:hypothetical protein [Deltaproteobacteria bacterium]MBW2536837.1 hypothetical protein [Deltaproteobacteria bacterium]
MRSAWYVALAGLSVVGVAHCSSEDDTTQTGAPTASPTASSSGTSTAVGGGGVGGNVGGGTNTGVAGWGQGGAHIVTCQGKIYECGDMIDNDGDGMIDWQDEECTGPCDNTEGSLYGGIPGQAGPACKVDCYFDQDSGSGNDQCYWDHVCDPKSISPDYYPEPEAADACEYTSGDVVITPIHQTCETLLQANGQLQECLDFCLPLTPNGCDCFGCCELPAGEGNYIWLGSEGLEGDTVCTMNDLADPDLCHPCTPVTDCFNGCGRCELCMGKTTLPPDCFGAGGSGAGGGPPSQRCDDGIQPCGLPGDDPCPPDQYCITGCCIIVPT